MATVEEIMGDVPGIHVPLDEIERSLRQVDPNNLWINYDHESDSVVMYFTGKPVHGINVWTEGDFYVIVDPFTHDIVGIQIDAWEKSFVPAHKKLNNAWGAVKETLKPGWSELLQIVMVWVIMVLQYSLVHTRDNDCLQPA